MCRCWFVLVDCGHNARYELYQTLSALVTETSQLMLYREIIAVCSEIHTKHINTLCGQNVELLNDKPGGIYSDHCVLKC